MPIYLRFENGMQVETTTLPKKPEGSGWYKAPTEFDWEKRYKLLEDNTVAECSSDEMQGDLLKNAKLAATETVRFILNNHRRSFAGYSHEKSRSYDIQEKTAKSIVAAVKNNQTPDEKDVELIAPLAELRSISVGDMAQLILTKSRKADRAIARCENIEDRAQRKIETCTTLDELKTFMGGFEQDVQTNLSKL